jgi:hypothetical protein
MPQQYKAQYASAPVQYASAPHQVVQYASAPVQQQYAQQYVQYAPQHMVQQQVLQCAPAPVQQEIMFPSSRGTCATVLVPKMITEEYVEMQPRIVAFALNVPMKWQKWVSLGQYSAAGYMQSAQSPTRGAYGQSAGAFTSPNFSAQTG